MLYESALVGAFNYLWGYRDAKENRLSIPEILNNAQNPLDSLLGDLIGRVEGRYFLIEFKRLESGFYDEVHAADAKPSRSALFEYLCTDNDCRQLARFGHFAAWASGSLHFAPYANTAGLGTCAAVQVPEPDYKSFECDFHEFYDGINTSDISFFAHNHLLFSNGLGISAEGMLRYIECVLGQWPSVALPDEEANALFGFFNPSTDALVVVPTSFDGLLHAFKEYRHTIIDRDRNARGMHP